MTDKFKRVWSDIEKELGACCLHKKAAYNEVSGNPVQQLTLVTCATPEKIEAFIGTRTAEKMTNRYRFTHNGVQIDMTTVFGVKNMDELCEKAFRHTLTIDSVGIRRDGKYIDRYNGISDIRKKTVRLSDEKAMISEGLLRRVLLLIANEGYKIDESLAQKIERDRFFEKESYRKRFCEVFTSVVRDENAGWDKASILLNVLGNILGHCKAAVNYTVKIKNSKNDERFIRAYLSLIFALIKATSKEIQPLFKGDCLLTYFDSICENMKKRVESQETYISLKEKYGDEFLELLFDVQEIWMMMENIPYKRPKESDFDMMAALISDESLWTNGEAQQNNKAEKVAAEKQHEPRIEGTFDFEKAVSEEYHEEDYAEPMEGLVEDTYGIEDNCDELNDRNDDINDIPAGGELDQMPPVQKKTVCVDDEAEETDDFGGFNLEGLEEYEAEAQERNEPTSVPQANLPQEHPVNVNGVINHSRGHSSKVLMNGGN